jgi:hypothetical protein
MDDADIKAEAREYVEHVARRSHPGRGCIPEQAFERAIKAAAASTKELHAAVKLAEESKGVPE